MKPGMSAVRLNSAPKSSSQMTGWIERDADPGRLAQERPDVAECYLPGVSQRGHAATSFLCSASVSTCWNERPAWRR